MDSGDELALESGRKAGAGTGRGLGFAGLFLGGLRL